MVNPKGGWGCRMTDEIRTKGNAADDPSTDAKGFYRDYWTDGEHISGESHARYQQIPAMVLPEGLKGKRVLEIGVGGEGGIILHLKKN
jgi:hypothetical protein